MKFLLETPPEKNTQQRQFASFLFSIIFDTLFFLCCIDSF